MANLKDTTILGNLTTTGDVIVAGNITENGQALSEKYALKGEAGGSGGITEIPYATASTIGGVRLTYNSTDKSLIIHTK